MWIQISDKLVYKQRLPLRFKFGMLNCPSDEDVYSYSMSAYMLEIRQVFQIGGGQENVINYKEIILLVHIDLRIS